MSRIARVSCHSPTLLGNSFERSRNRSKGNRVSAGTCDEKTVTRNYCIWSTHYIPVCSYECFQVGCVLQIHAKVVFIHILQSELLCDILFSAGLSIFSFCEKKEQCLVSTSSILVEVNSFRSFIAIPLWFETYFSRCKDLLVFSSLCTLQKNLDLLRGYTQLRKIWASAQEERMMITRSSLHRSKFSNAKDVRWWAEISLFMEMLRRSLNALTVAGSY